MTEQDDTQPNLPVTDESEFDDTPPAPGCLLWGTIIGFALLLGLAIVILAGAAGWTEGQNEGDRRAADAEFDLRGVQLTRIPAELEANNAELVEIRLNYLETVVPNEPALAGIRATVTQMAIHNATATLSAAVDPVIAGIAADVEQNNLGSLQNRLGYLQQVIPGAPIVAELQATITALKAEQTQPTEQAVIAEATEDATPPPITSDNGGFDLQKMLNDAKVAFAQGNYEDAYDLLDAMKRIDNTAFAADVQGLLNETLTAWARGLFLSPDETSLAEAIRVTNLLEDAGGALGDLEYERFVGALYLDAMRAIDLGSHSLAIQRLNELRSYQTEYKGVNLTRLLFNEYITMAETQMAVSQFCAAVPDFNRALTLFNEAGVRSQMESAQQLCDMSQTQTAVAPTPDPFVTATPGQSG